MPGVPMCIQSVAAHRANNIEWPWQAADEYAAKKWRGIPPWMFETPRSNRAAKAAEPSAEEPAPPPTPFRQQATVQHHTPMSAEVQTEIAAGRELSRAFKRQSASRSDLMIPFHDKKTNTAAAETSDATINPPLETTKGTDRMLAVASAEPEIDRSISHVVGHQERPSSQAVAINDQGKRVDVPLPDDAEVDDYALHRLAVKQCFNYHLSGSCKNFDCANSHDPVNEGVRNALIKLAHRFPCNNGRACRHSACFWGHTCLDAGYESGKKAWKCKLGPAMHKRLEITSFVKV